MVMLKEIKYVGYMKLLIAGNIRERTTKGTIAKLSIIITLQIRRTFGDAIFLRFFKIIPIEKKRDNMKIPLLKVENSVVFTNMRERMLNAKKEPLNV
jgi:hypothetical protein